METNAGERLSRISTNWETLLEAHAAQPGEGAKAAQRRLLRRYNGVVYRYLVSALRDPDVAEDLCQEFAVRFLRGDFGNVQRSRGRFRNYVKTVLINLVNDHFRQRGKWPNKLPSGIGAAQQQAPNEDSQFLASCRKEALDRTWFALFSARPKYHAVLRMRVENPDLSSREIAQRMSDALGTSFTSARARKTLERAHRKFADLLLDEVALGLESPSESELAAELVELDLLKYCRSALARRSSKNG